MKTGDVVTLKSGGQRMTVIAIDSSWPWPVSPEYKCQWFIGSELQTQIFDAMALKKVSASGSSTHEKPYVNIYFAPIFSWRRRELFNHLKSGVILACMEYQEKYGKAPTMVELTPTQLGLSRCFDSDGSITYFLGLKVGSPSRTAFVH